MVCPVVRSYQRRLRSSVKGELDDEIAGKVLRLGFTPFLPPQADEGGFVLAHKRFGPNSASQIEAARLTDPPGAR
jgi:hypothetical protein